MESARERKISAAFAPAFERAIGGGERGVEIGSRGVPHGADPVPRSRIEDIDRGSSAGLAP
jgi:hypothetical protein